ncbi:hypothetical protein NDU88_000422 [Pleurodeles waltl]|uniref:Uncharacterized protein n=1 Tax=Pleurodeles waltl TaxID=8319 RepID=A0AAV7MGT5_PLEWA|nr:hypothetical protein NDU88_000422 [Pleurodeles waltl]
MLLAGTELLPASGVRWAAFGPVLAGLLRWVRSGGVGVSGGALGPVQWPLGRSPRVRDEKRAEESLETQEAGSVCRALHAAVGCERSVWGLADTGGPGWPKELGLFVGLPTLLWDVRGECGFRQSPESQKGGLEVSVTGLPTPLWDVWGECRITREARHHQAHYTVE